MVRVAVLMSTYNGEKYIREQIDSILAQENVDVTLYIRDDGSKDATIDIIKDYAKRYSNIVMIEGENLGVGNSFISIMLEPGSTFDYYSFSDQDDIWLPKKILRAIETLREYNDIPTCYCSNQTLVDKKGNIISQRHEKPIDTTCLRILNNNQVTGCTMVWNRKLQKILIEPQRLPSKELLHKRIHDVWLAMVSSVTGTIMYDPNSFIHYRQHGDNVVGAEGTTKFDEWKKKLFDSSLRNGRSSLAEEIIAKFDDLILDEEIKHTLSIYANYKSSWNGKRQLLQLISDKNMSYYSGESVLQLKMKILLNLI